MAWMHRKGPDKRFVKHVLSPQHQPTTWMPMDVQSVECKVMEVRKFSAEYLDVNTKFNRYLNRNYEKRVLLPDLVDQEMSEKE